MSRIPYKAGAVAADQKRPFVSVIVPVYNAQKTIQQCLCALQANQYPNWDCLIVDDGSVDDSHQMCRDLGFRIISSERSQSGPAMARNIGARETEGPILLFIDSDVVVQPDIVAQVGDLFGSEPDLAACIGSYDDAPAESNFLSQYKNLQHHYVHQASHEEASTFWGGCGAIRQDIFLEMGGFNTSYARPSIEDIELGYRLRRHGYRIRLLKQLQVKHLKRWTARSLILTDIRDRAIPWTRLILEKGKMLNDLNLQTGQRLSVVSVWLGLLALVTAVFFLWALLLAGLACAALLLLNRHFYRFLFEKRGLLFLLLALPWHWLYFAYSGLIFGILLVGDWMGQVLEKLHLKKRSQVKGRTRPVA